MSTYRGFHKFSAASQKKIIEQERELELLNGLLASLKQKVNLDTTTLKVMATAIATTTTLATAPTFHPMTTATTSAAPMAMAMAITTMAAAPTTPI